MAQFQQGSHLDPRQYKCQIKHWLRRNWITVLFVFLLPVCIARLHSLACGRAGGWPQIVERLYCKRPIQCLASSKILTPPPPHCPASVYPPSPRLWWGGRTHSLGGDWRGGWVVNILEDARHSSVLCIFKYFCPKLYDSTETLVFYIQQSIYALHPSLSALILYSSRAVDVCTCNS